MPGTTSTSTAITPGTAPIAIEQHTLLVRGQRVLLDADLAALHGVSTKALVQAVKRNAERFPEDFGFQLKNPEVNHLRSQIVTSSSAWGGRRTAPYAFTEQGVAMRSSVLRSARAIASRTCTVARYDPRDSSGVSSGAWLRTVRPRPSRVRRRTGITLGGARHRRADARPRNAGVA
ncbi:MAG: ORF6N domain-containing protein [Gammaproteobacteria bacterium]|nr:ORF6N domain-containing protein [Gammaproteobacteria bacterium]